MKPFEIAGYEEAVLAARREARNRKSCKESDTPHHRKMNAYKRQKYRYQY